VFKRIQGRSPSDYRAQLAQGWDGIEISAVGSERNGSLVGHSLAAIADRRHTPPLEAMLDLLVEERGDVNMLEINQSEENLREALCHPLSNVISDGFYVKGRPHPRLLRIASFRRGFRRFLRSVYGLGVYRC